MLIAALIPVGLLVGAVIAIVVGEEQRQHRRADVVSAWHSAKNREEVRTRLGDPSFTTNTTVGARNVRCDVFNADDSLVDASVQFSFCYDRDGKRIAGPDPLEPNDDIPYLHTYRIPPLTRPGKPWANIHGRLDDWPHGGIENRLFDDEDVYRIWLPAQHAVHIRLEPTTDIGLEVWDTATPNVYLTGAARNRHLIAESDTPGTTTRRLTLSRPSAATAYVFLDLYLFENGPNHTEYHLTVTPAT